MKNEKNRIFVKISFLYPKVVDIFSMLKIIINILIKF